MSVSASSDARTRALKSMQGGHYEIPKSANMLSHLTNDKALKDYKYETARKLVQRQEELLRNLAKVRAAMELEESQIGKTKDYYLGSREKKYEHTLNRAENLRRTREVNEIITPEKVEYVSLPMPTNTNCTYTTDNKGYTDDWKGYTGDWKGYTGDWKGYTGEGDRVKFQSEIKRLKGQVDKIANRYKPETKTTEATLQYDDAEYLPGTAYVQQMYPDERAEVYASGPELAQYFPVTRYVLY